MIRRNQSNRSRYVHFTGGGQGSNHRSDLRESRLQQAGQRQYGQPDNVENGNAYDQRYRFRQSHLTTYGGERRDFTHDPSQPGSSQQYQFENPTRSDEALLVSRRLRSVTNDLSQPFQQHPNTGSADATSVSSSPQTSPCETLNKNSNQHGVGQQASQVANVQGSSRAPVGWKPEDRGIAEFLINKADLGQDLEEEEIIVNERPNGFDMDAAKMKSWDDAKFPEMLQTNIKRCNYDAPRTIQKMAIPVIQKGYDLIGQCETAGGKTAAYLLPIIEACMSTQRRPLCPVAFVIVPTHELVQQIYEDVKRLTDGTDVTAARAFGNFNFHKNLNEIGAGCDIIVATPGRLLHLCSGAYISTNNLRFFVSDECDLLLNKTGRKTPDSMRSQIDAIFNKSPMSAQTIMFSATIGSYLAAEAHSFMRNDMIVHLKNRIAAPNKKIVLKFVVDRPEPLRKFDAINLFVEMCKGQENVYKKQAILFAKSSETIRQIASSLVGFNIENAPLCRNIHQELRDKAMNLFKKGRLAVLAVSDRKARGLDFKNVDLVVNFEMPADVETFIHRVGRCGRHGAGEALTFVTRDDKRILLELRHSIAAAGHNVPASLNEALNSF